MGQSYREVDFGPYLVTNSSLTRLAWSQQLRSFLLPLSILLLRIGAWADPTRSRLGRVETPSPPPQPQPPPLGGSEARTGFCRRPMRGRWFSGRGPGEAKDIPGHDAGRGECLFSLSSKARLECSHNISLLLFLFNQLLLSASSKAYSIKLQQNLNTLI